MGLDWNTRRNDAAYDVTTGDLQTLYVAAGDEAVLVHNSPTTPVRYRQIQSFTGLNEAAQQRRHRPASGANAIDLAGDWSDGRPESLAARALRACVVGGSTTTR